MHVWVEAVSEEVGVWDPVFGCVGGGFGEEGGEGVEVLEEGGDGRGVDVYL